MHGEHSRVHSFHAAHTSLEKLAVFRSGQRPAKSEADSLCLHGIPHVTGGLLFASSPTAVDAEGSSTSSGDSNANSDSDAQSSGDSDDDDDDEVSSDSPDTAPTGPWDRVTAGLLSSVLQEGGVDEAAALEFLDQEEEQAAAGFHVCGASERCSGASAACLLGGARCLHARSVKLDLARARRH